MRTPRQRRPFPFWTLGSILFVQVLFTGCAREENRTAPGGSPPQVVGSGEPAPVAIGPAITKAGVNPPGDGNFTCWISGSGFQGGDKVLVNGTTEIATTLGGAELVTFVGPVELLKGRTALSLVVIRPGTELRSNPFDARIPSVSTKN